MARKYIMSTGLLSALFNNADTPLGITPTEQQAPVEPKNEETGIDRLKKMFQEDEFGELSPELNSVLQVGCMSLFIGSLYGGFINSRVAYMEFFKYNEATVFKDHLDAKKKLQDKVTTAFGKGAFRWSWRLTFFSMSYVCISTAISVYRDKSSIVEHLAAGATIGSIYKFNMGPKGWIVGGGLGMALGLIGGGTTLSLLKLSGMSMQEVRQRNIELFYKREQAYNEGVREYVEKENSLLRKHRETNG